MKKESDMCRFRSFNNSPSKIFFNLLKSVKLRVWKVVIERITVGEFRIDNGGGNGAGCFEDMGRYIKVHEYDSSKVEIWSKKVSCSTKIKPKLREKWVVVKEESCILESC